MILKHARGELDLDGCLVMGIVNRTPDSFFDGGLHLELDAAVQHGLALAKEGADVLDLGAVKAGPGETVTEAQEADLLLPLVETLASSTDVPLSVETAHPSIAARACAAGAAIINDVSGLADPELAVSCARAGAALVLMHNGGQIRGRPRHPRYADVVQDVRRELLELADRASAAGVARDRVMIDPGLDFGKNTFHSLALMRGLDVLVDTGIPVLVAASRKDVVGETLDLPPGDRLEGSLALAALAAAAGAAMVRVHDVAATVRVVRMVDAVRGISPPEAPLRGLWD